ncbi:EamA family transporter [Diaphorobacter ruginosibacter]|uniref:EamA family transporter n=1 Tax=Diaphorobacter ruginosibacter TaxID=1715720 RepID=A0A7G9RSY3_9BURK|nr:DMT family transporter [Diaphorobacter ruginosibacter]QNN58708.1 EamA family transporter [Diaphorobacter ruginosibacter]
MNAKLSAAAAAILWGFTYVLTTTWLPPHPLFLAAFRALGGALVLLAIVRCMPPRIWWGRMAVLGTLNAGLFFGLFFVAATRLPGGVAAIFQALTPLAVIFIAWGLLGARPTATKVGSVLLGALGVSLVVLSSHAQLDPLGMAAAIGSMLSIATGGVLLNKWGQPPMPLLGFTGWQLLIAGVELTVVAVLAQDAPAQLDAANVLGLGLLAVALTAVPFALWFGAIERAGAVAVAPFMLLVPVTAFVLDALVKGVQPSGLQVVGAAVVMGGLMLSQRAAGKPGNKSTRHVNNTVAHD